jgi:hypothetical protein
MTNGIFFISHSFRTALAAVLQCPIRKRLLIHSHVIVVSARNRAAMRAFFRSPLRRRFKSASVQRACVSISFTKRSALLLVGFLQLVAIMLPPLFLRNQFQQLLPESFWSPASLTPF